MRIPIFTSRSEQSHRANLVRDLAVIILSILLAILLARTGSIDWLIREMGDWQILGIFFAGLFFTSVFTSAPAMVLLGEAVLYQPIWLVAMLGALGAACGDFFIYRFIKDSISDDFAYLLSLAPRIRLPHIFQSRIFKWLPPFFGALIIASPLPDELGVVILGLAKAPKPLFILISYSFNFIGIAIVGWVARSL